MLGSALGQALRSKPALDGGRKDFDPWRNHATWSRLRQSREPDQIYTVRLPERLAAYTQYQFDIDADALLDEFGRRLDRSVSIRFHTAHRR